MPRGQAESSVVDAAAEERIAVPSGLIDLLPPPPGPPFGEDPLPPSLGPVAGPVVANARLGMVVFLAFEAMFFVGLIGAFLVFRLGSPLWPPVGQPRLPLIVTWVNTLTLLFSGYTMRSALRANRVGDRQGLTSALSGTALLEIGRASCRERV